MVLLQFFKPGTHQNACLFNGSDFVHHLDKLIDCAIINEFLYLFQNWN